MVEGSLAVEIINMLSIAKMATDIQRTAEGAPMDEEVAKPSREIAFQALERAHGLLKLSEAPNEPESWEERLKLQMRRILNVVNSALTFLPGVSSGSTAGQAAIREHLERVAGFAREGLREDEASSS